MHSGYFAQDCWTDNGAIFELMTKLDMAAVNITTQEAFQELLHKWSLQHDIHQQHDAGEFLQHLLQWLKPACENVEWMPRWHLGVTAQAAEEVKKGAGWSVLSFNAALYPDDTPLQVLINDWHGSEGHQFALKDSGRGFAFQLERLIAPAYTRKIS